MGSTAAGLSVIATKVDSGEEIHTFSQGMGGNEMPTSVTLHGRQYLLREPSGEGESSSVWRIIDLEGKSWALKVGRSKAVGPLLALEAERLMWIGSSSLAEVVDAGRLPSSLELTNQAGQAMRLVRDAPFLVMQWCEGERLDALDVPLVDRPRFALRVLADLGRALSDMHGAGVAHGDVKPANILVEVTA